jgi:hypothetical protein
MSKITETKAARGVATWGRISPSQDFYGWLRPVWSDIVWFILLGLGRFVSEYVTGVGEFFSGRVF